MKTLVMRVTLAALFCCQLSAAADARVFGRPAPSWNSNYYDPQWAGVPHAMVVPPTVHREVKYGWGASGTEVHRIRNQYSIYGNRPDGTFPGGPFQPQPVPPTHSDQFGTYYIRAPWK